MGTPAQLLPAPVAELMDQDISLHMATRDAALRPECVQVWGPRLDGDTLTVHLPVARSRRTLANIADNQQFALTICRLEDYRTYQLKGRALSWRAGRLDERARIDRQLEAFARGGDYEGVGDVIRRWMVGPTIAIDLEIREVFYQTPRPGAGRRVES